MIKVAVVGCGYWGKNLVRNFYELKVLDLVCDNNKDVLKQVNINYPNIKTTSEFEEVLEKKDIQAIAIATPAVTHYNIAKKVILSDKDVFVEKPLAITTSEAQELIRLAKEKNKILMVGHILHYHPAIIKLKEIIQEGLLGKIQYIYSNRLNIGKLRTEENILWSFAPHDISVILSLLKDEPIRVSAFGEDYLNKGIYDTTLTMLEFKNKIKAHIFVSWLHPFKEQKLIVVGSQAMAVFDDLTEEKLFLYPHKIEWKNGQIPVAQKAEVEVISVEKKEPLKEELKHFIECVETRNQPLTDGEEGLKVLKILETAEESLRKQKAIETSLSNLGRRYFVHESAYIDEDVQIGEGSQIWHFSHILKGSRIGKNCKIGQNVVIGPNVKIGNGCKIQNNVSLYEGVELEDYVFCGPSCVFTNVFNPRSEIPRMNELRKTLVKQGATIGANATIVCGNTLGRYSFVGAGAVVTKDVPDYALVYGNPAKIKGWMCECGIKLEFNKSKAICKVCAKQYRKKQNKVERIK